MVRLFQVALSRVPGSSVLSFGYWGNLDGRFAQRIIYGGSSAPGRHGLQERSTAEKTGKEGDRSYRRTEAAARPLAKYRMSGSLDNDLGGNNSFTDLSKLPPLSPGADNLTRLGDLSKIPSLH